MITYCENKHRSFAGEFLEEWMRVSVSGFFLYFSIRNKLLIH